MLVTQGNRQQISEDMKKHIDQAIEKGKQFISIGKYGWICRHPQNNTWTWGYYCGTIPAGIRGYKTAHGAMQSLLDWMNNDSIL